MAHDLERLGHDAAYPADAARACFADEAAIDFPSLDAAVARMREAFADGAGSDRIVEAHVTLSCADARRGREVVVTVPVRRTCTVCGGRGESWSEPCAACAGAGDSLEERALAVAVPPGIRDGARLRVALRPPRALEAEVLLRVSVGR
jgi:hypothetical protein